MALLRTGFAPTFDLSDQTELNFSVDWLSFSYCCSVPDPLSDPIISRIITSVYPCLDVFDICRGRFSFLSGYSTDGCVILFEPAGNSTSMGVNACHVIFSGSGLSFARQVLADSFDDWLMYIYDHCRIGRIDLALDVFDCPHIDHVIHALENHEYTSIWRVWSCIHSQDDGFTYTLGRRGGSSYFRVYNKFAEQKKDKILPPEGVDSWYRFELELRDVDSTLRANLPHMDRFTLKDFYFTFMSGRLSIPCAPVSPFSYKVPAPEQRPQLLIHPDPINKKVDWVRRQVLPTILNLNKVFGEDFLTYLIGSSPVVPYKSFMYEYLLKHMPDVAIEPFKPYGGKDYVGNSTFNQNQ